jgi:DNA-binding CsgD family transcriptional regulator
MNYISAREAAAKWGISLRRVQQLLAKGRIEDTKRYGRSWALPETAEKPADPRRGKKQPKSPLESELAYVLEAASASMPDGNPDAILDALGEERLRLQYEAELAYLRGDFEKTLRCFTKTEGDDAARLRVCPVAVPAAISAGDYRAFSEMEAYLKQCAAAHAGGGAAALAELARATAAVSVIAPLLVPTWLAEGDLSALAPQARPNALYLRAKYFQCLGNYDAMLATAQAALAFCMQEGKITTTDIYLRVTCAVACHSLGQEGKARRWLLDAMAGALPNGFITPFAEVVTALGGLVEQCLKQAFPTCYGAVMNQWQRTWKNWISFHNRFTRENITLILTLREYHIALMAAQRVPYAVIAKKQGISVGRLKNIMQEIYGKLCISGRNELSQYIF